MEHGVLKMSGYFVYLLEEKEAGKKSYRTIMALATATKSFQMKDKYERENPKNKYRITVMDLMKE